MVPGGTVTGTLTAPVPVLVTVTTPFCSVAVDGAGRQGRRPGRLVGQDVADAAQGELLVGGGGVEVASYSEISGLRTS